MIHVNAKYMDEESFEKVKEKVQDHFKSAFPDAKTEVLFEPSLMIGECDPRIVVFIEANRYQEALDYWMSDALTNYCHAIEEEYGIFSITVRKILNNNEVEASIGDIVLIDNDRCADEEAPQTIGIISSVITCDGKKFYGCSHIVITYYGWYKKNDHSIELTRSDYGGYISSFAKKLTIEEARVILENNAALEYKRSIERLYVEHLDTMKSVGRLLDSLSQEKHKVKEVSQLVLPEESLGFNVYCSDEMKDNLHTD